MRVRLGTILGLAAAAAAFLAPYQAGAIPAFARKYRVSCSTCHSPFPRLKPYGEEFAGRGFRLEDPAQEPPRATLDAGDDLLQLPRDLPLAVRFDLFGAWDSGAAAKTDFQTPWVAKILSGGPIADGVSYYVYFIIESGEVVGLEDAWVQWTRMFGLPLGLFAGQFQVCDPIFKRELRLMRLDYEILRVHVGASAANLTYDRGLGVTWDGPGFEVVAQLVNGNGIPPLGAGGTFDSDPYKNVALRVAVPIGPARLGALGYWGQERLNGVHNELYYVGPDLVLELGEWAQLSAIYLWRSDTNPLFLPPPQGRISTHGGFGELLVFPDGPAGRWALSLLYNRVQSDDVGARRDSGSLGASFLLRRNVRLVAEAARDFELDGNRVSLGTVVAF
jgi:hypothetical protein